MLLEKEDEMDCLVGGANFLLKAIHHEAFMYENSQTLFTPSNCEHPSLLIACIWSQHGIMCHCKDIAQAQGMAIVACHTPSWDATGLLQACHQKLGNLQS